MDPGVIAEELGKAKDATASGGDATDHALLERLLDFVIDKVLKQSERSGLHALSLISGDFDDRLVAAVGAAEDPARLEDMLWGDQRSELVSGEVSLPDWMETLLSLELVSMNTSTQRYTVHNQVRHAIALRTMLKTVEDYQQEFLVFLEQRAETERQGSKQRRT